MWALGRIPVLGYTPLMLVITFFGGLTALGLGIIGQYLWLSLQNARTPAELHREVCASLRAAARVAAPRTEGV